MFFYAISILTLLISMTKRFTEIAITACPYNIKFNCYNASMENKLKIKEEKIMKMKEKEDKKRFPWRF